MRFKRLEVPRNFRSAVSEGNALPHPFFRSPRIGRDGWYRMTRVRYSTDWVELDGVVYASIGDFLDVLEDLTIVETPIRDCNYQMIAGIRLYSPDANLKKILWQEYKRRSARRSKPSKKP